MSTVLCMTQRTLLLTVPQVVERLAAAGVEVSQESVRQWARSGRVTAVRLPSGHYRFRPSDVDALLEPIPAAS